MCNGDFSFSVHFIDTILFFFFCVDHLCHIAYIHTYIHTLLMLPKWAFQLNRIKKYKYIN